LYGSWISDVFDFMNSHSTSLLPLLKQFFGFDSFRTLQEEIIRDALAGRDVIALLPTGGGKSLCFQLPALVRPGLTVVVSPLISLMKDQVDALTASGVAATFLNSSLKADESRARLRGLHAGEYRLLYVAPERMMLSGFLADLKGWNVKLLAIDEAHCISEWGHDFRPEYRQLAQLRQHFPDVPMMALTATATERVRGDIAKQLHLRQPGRYVASFNRPNLTYRVLPKQNSYSQLAEFVRARKDESGIVYCQSRRSAESLAERLSLDGVKAAPYHAGLDAKTRTVNQELFLRDEVTVVCATIAFGMGINKPNVRFVVHYDLPKNVEGFYQETGRAGRDGLPSECLLLFSAGDAVKYSKFIDEVSDEHERQIARRQLRQMVDFAESHECRRATLLRYFGEDWRELNCGGCDNCLTPRETFDGTVEAQKFLSCVYRVREKSGFDFGVNQIAEVLTGAETEKVKKWDHQTVSTYGIGTEHSQAQWKLIGRELIRLGFLHQLPEKFNVLQVTEEGRQALKERQPIQLAKSILESRAKQTRAERDRSIPSYRARGQRSGEIACDEVLFDRLRRLRKQLADKRGVPAYIIFSDVSLRQMAQYFPSNKEEFARISGVGERKLKEFGERFIAEIAAHRSGQAKK
jgi:ATP-dependent DNA helicase RecQ